MIVRHTLQLTWFGAQTLNRLAAIRLVTFHPPMNFSLTPQISE